jgi:cellulose biosynthesis protein BcsQ
VPSVTRTRGPLGQTPRVSDTSPVTTLTVGVTTARFPDCKRGVAVNLAASVARDAGRPARVCVIDADPSALDVTTRFAAGGPYVEDFAAEPVPAEALLRAAHEPSLWVLPTTGVDPDLVSRGALRAVRELRNDFDVVICDLATPLGATPLGSTPLGSRTPSPALAGAFDWLLVAVTPDVEPVEATAYFLEQLDDARRRGDIAGAPRVGVITTGDEASTDLAPDVVARALRRPVLGSVRQLWGRAAPNSGFGAALGIAELDDAVAALFDRLSGLAGHNVAVQTP